MFGNSCLVLSRNTRRCFSVTKDNCCHCLHLACSSNCWSFQDFSFTKVKVLFSRNCHQERTFLCAKGLVQYQACSWFRNLFLFGSHIGKHEIFLQFNNFDLSGYFMGAVESSTEENSVIRFVDSVEIRYGEDTSIVTQENGWNEHVSGEGEFVVTECCGKLTECSLALTCFISCCSADSSVISCFIRLWHWSYVRKHHLSTLSDEMSAYFGKVVYHFIKFTKYFVII